MSILLLNTNLHSLVFRCKFFKWCLDVLTIRLFLQQCAGRGSSLIAVLSKRRSISFTGNWLHMIRELSIPLCFSHWWKVSFSFFHVMCLVGVNWFQSPDGGSPGNLLERLTSKNVTARVDSLPQHLLWSVRKGTAREKAIFCPPTELGSDFIDFCSGGREWTPTKWMTNRTEYGVLS